MDKIYSPAGTWLDWKTDASLIPTSWPSGECWGYFATLADVLAHSASPATCSCGGIFIKTVQTLFLFSFCSSPRMMNRGARLGADILRWEESRLLRAGAVCPAPAPTEAELGPRPLQEAPDRVELPPGPRCEVRRGQQRPRVGLVLRRASHVKHFLNKVH